MKMSLIALAVLAAAAASTGCASLTDAGHSGYTVQRATTPDGNVTTGYNLSVQDGKEFAARTITFTATPEGSVTFSVSEHGVKAFRGQATAVKGLSLFPVTGLDDLLGQ